MLLVKQLPGSCPFVGRLPTYVRILEHATVAEHPLTTRGARGSAGQGDLGRLAAGPLRPGFLCVRGVAREILAS